MSKKLILNILFLNFSLALYSQDYDKLLGGSEKDINHIINQYTDPIVKTTLFSLSQNWTTSAKPLSKFQIQFSIKANLSKIDPSLKSFKYTNGNTIRSKTEDYLLLPTSLGGKSSTDEVSFWISPYSVPFLVPATGETVHLDVDGFFLPDASFKIPLQGLTNNIDIFALPIPQLNMGLWFDSEISVRYISNDILKPKSSFSMYGIALKKNIYFKEKWNNHQYLSVLLGVNNIATKFSGQFRNRNKSTEYIMRSNAMVYNFDVIFSKHWGRFALNINIGASKNTFKSSFNGEINLPQIPVSEDVTKAFKKYYDVSIIDNQYQVNSFPLYSTDYNDVYTSIKPSYQFGRFIFSIGYSHGLYRHNINTGLDILINKYHLNKYRRREQIKRRRKRLRNKYDRLRQRVRFIN